MRAGDRWVALAAGGVSLALYLSTLAPGLVFPPGDSHELVLNAARLGVPHPSGYPIYTWLGFLAIHALPIGEPAWRMNLLSAVLGAAGVGMLFLVGNRLGLPRFIAVAAALLFGISRTFWSQTAIAEIYTADVLALVVAVWLLLRWADRPAATRRFAAFGLALGVSLGTHLSNLLYAPAYALFVVLTDPGVLRRPRQIALAFGAFLLGAAQYLWLPLRGGRFDVYPNEPPVTLGALWSYTAGAFANLRFAFPLSALPQRLTLFLQLLADNLTLPGVALGLAGMWVVLALDPARFWLLAGILVANAAVFSQFAVPDPEVFFLPSWVVWALFAGFGAWALWDGGLAVLAPGAPRRRTMLGGLAAVLVAAGLAAQARNGLARNDRRDDTAVADFDRNALAMLPRGAVLVTPRGAFGAGMAYWRDVVGLRPDVGLASQSPPPDPMPGPRFSTVTLADGRPTASGRTGQAPWALPADGWYVPILLGGRLGQVLARVDGPPALVEPAPPAAAFIAPGTVLGPVTLTRASVTPWPDAPRPRVRLETRWRLAAPLPLVVSTRVDDRTIESHELGFGNLARYATQVEWPPGGFVVEDVDVVLPSRLAPGPHIVRVGITVFEPTSFHTEWMDVGVVAIP